MVESQLLVSSNFTGRQQYKFPWDVPGVFLQGVRSCILLAWLMNIFRISSGLLFL